MTEPMWIIDNMRLPFQQMTFLKLLRERWPHAADYDALLIRLYGSAGSYHLINLKVVASKVRKAMRAEGGDIAKVVKVGYRLVLPGQVLPGQGG